MNRFQLDYKFRDDPVKSKQELWRRKQFEIFYSTGRPIFNIDEETQHLRRHNNPYFHEDKNERFRIFSQRKIIDTPNEKIE